MHTRKSTRPTFSSFGHVVCFSILATACMTLIAPVQAAVSCSTASSNAKTWYHGPSASYMYDQRPFRKGPDVSKTIRDKRIPQGAATWHSWNGTSADLLVYTAYVDGGYAAIQGYDPASGKYTKIAYIAESHAGGIAIAGNWAFVQGGRSADGKWATIRKYRLSDLRAAFKSSAASTYVKQAGTPRNVYGASFLSSYGGYLYSGQFNETKKDKMYRYKINADGSLTTQAGAIDVPMKTQGLTITKGHYVFSTSYGRDKRSNLYVVKRGYPRWEVASGKCFRAPSMSEGLTQLGGHTYVLFESGGYKFRANARNVINGFHTVRTVDLTKLAP